MSLCLLKASIRLSIVTSIKSRRVVPNGDPHLSVAYDVTSFMTSFGLYKLCLRNAWMRLWMVPSIRSRRVISNGGPHLSVAYDLTCLMKGFGLVQTWSICVKTWSKVSIFRCPFVSSAQTWSLTQKHVQYICQQKREWTRAISQLQGSECVYW